MHGCHANCCIAPSTAQAYLGIVNGQPPPLPETMTAVHLLPRRTKSGPSDLLPRRAFFFAEIPHLPPVDTGWFRAPFAFMNGGDARL